MDDNPYKAPQVESKPPPGRINRRFWSYLFFITLLGVAFTTAVAFVVAAWLLERRLP